MQVALSWTPSTGASSYNVRRSVTSGGPYTTIATPSSPSYTDAPLTNGTTYYYVVNAVFPGGAVTANTNEASVQPMPVIPAAPTLSASAGDTQVQLSWTPSYEATGYTLSRGLTSGSYTTFINVTGTIYTDTALTNGTTYFYVVAGNNIAGSGSNSAEVSARPLPAAIPPVPSGVTALGGNAQVTLSWSPSYEAASYNILRGTVSGGPYTTIATLTGTTYLDTGLTNQATYYYVLSAVNLDGTSAMSTEVAATPSNLPANSATRIPLTDAFVRDGSFANTNSGTATDLLVKYVSTANSGYSRQAFLRFSVAGLASATSVQIWLVPISLGSESGSTTINYEYVANDTWIESGSGGITWNNKPAGSGTNFATTIGGYSIGQPIQVDVTSFAQTKAASDGMLTMRLYSPTADSSGNESVDFGSKENTPGYQPLLVYVGATPLLDAWRYLYFGGYTNSGVAADTANPSGDGIANLMKYATGSNPLVSSSSPVLLGKTTDGKRMTITFNRIADPVLTYSVQAATTLGGTWTSIWSSTGSANVAGAITIQDSAVISSGFVRFLRLVVSH
jgi:fibronectin type 3 domain-containing protein